MVRGGEIDMTWQRDVELRAHSMVKDKLPAHRGYTGPWAGFLVNTKLLDAGVVAISAITVALEAAHDAVTVDVPQSNRSALTGHASASDTMAAMRCFALELRYRPFRALAMEEQSVLLSPSLDSLETSLSWDIEAALGGVKEALGEHDMEAWGALSGPVLRVDINRVHGRISVLDPPLRAVQIPGGTEVALRDMVATQIEELYMEAFRATRGVGGLERVKGLPLGRLFPYVEGIQNLHEELQQVCIDVEDLIEGRVDTLWRAKSE